VWRSASHHPTNAASPEKIQLILQAETACYSRLGRFCCTSRCALEDAKSVGRESLSPSDPFSVEMRVFFVKQWAQKDGKFRNSSRFGVQWQPEGRYEPRLVSTCGHCIATHVAFSTGAGGPKTRGRAGIPAARQTPAIRCNVGRCGSGNRHQPTNYGARVCGAQQPRPANAKWGGRRLEGPHWTGIKNDITSLLPHRWQPA
jgi:hypothetical protein